MFCLPLLIRLTVQLSMGIVQDVDRYRWLFNEPHYTTGMGCVGSWRACEIDSLIRFELFVPSMGP